MLMTPGLYEASRRVMPYIERRIEKKANVVFGPYPASKQALLESLHRGYDREGNLFCDSEATLQDMRDAGYRDAKIGRVGPVDAETSLKKTEKELLFLSEGKLVQMEASKSSKGKGMYRGHYTYIGGANAFTDPNPLTGKSDSRITLLGTNPKIYASGVTLKGLKKMGYYATPHIVLCDASGFACFEGDDSPLRIGSEELPIPLEVVKGREEAAEEYLMKELLPYMSLHLGKSAINGFILEPWDMKALRKEAPSYPNDLSLMNLRFAYSPEDAKNAASAANGQKPHYGMMERLILNSKDINAVGIHASMKPTIMIVGKDIGDGFDFAIDNYNDF